MTRQRPHTITIAGAAYVLCEHDGGPLFDPTQHGARIVRFTSAAPHGYICGYGVSAGELVLVSLATSLHPAVRELPTLGPAISIGTDPFLHLWSDLAVPIRFTGSLLAGRCTKRDRSWRATALRCEQVLELVLEDGRVLGQADVSEFFVRLRRAYAAITKANSADAEAATRSLVEAPTGLSGDYGFVEDLRSAWEHEVRVRTNEARRAARAAAHRKLPKRDALAVEQASTRWLEEGRPEGAWVEGTCPRCDQVGKLRVCQDRGMAVCYPCYWEL